MDAHRIQAVFFDIGNTLVVSGTREWVPGARQLLRDLGAAGVRLGVISNTDRLSRDELAPLLPADFDWDAFEARLVILSFEVGHEKPEREIFDIALGRAGGDPSASLFCTESLVDTLAAQTVGMRTARVIPPPASDLSSVLDALRTVRLLS